jgi:hypothetical protein
MGHEFAKRHRSLTPNLPVSGRGSLSLGTAHSSSYLTQRYHPYSTGGAAVLGQQGGTSRASSLGPGVLQSRPSSLGQYHHVSATDIEPQALELGLAANPVAPQFAIRQSGLDLVPPAHGDTLDFPKERSEIVHGLKDGADGDQIAAQKLAEWGDTT